MAVQPAYGTVVVSVDIDNRHATGRNEAAAGEAVFDLLAERGLPATYAFTEPCAARLADRVLALPTAGEVALLGHPAWMSQRAHLAAELARHTTQARAAGYSLSTLVLRDTALDKHSDLLVKQGFTAMRGMACRKQRAWLGAWANWLALSARGGDTRARGPQAIRFGLWHFVPTMSLVGAGYGTALRQLDRAADCQGLFHLAIDARELAGNRSTELRQLARLLQQTSRRRSEGTLVMETLAEVARRLCRPRQTPCAQSILRPLAA